MLPIAAFNRAPRSIFNGLRVAHVPARAWLVHGIRLDFLLLPDRWIRANGRWIIDGLRIATFGNVLGAAPASNRLDQGQAVGWDRMILMKRRMIFG